MGHGNRIVWKRKTAKKQFSNWVLFAHFPVTNDH